MQANQFAMVGLGKLAQALLGDQPLVRGLTCEPTAPASLQVQVSPGEIYQLANVDDTPYGDWPADTQHTVVKQGLLSESALLDCPVPQTAGHRVTHLIQARWVEVDDEKDLLPYYNASDPRQVWWGVNNEGKTQPTVRHSLCQVILKPGITAPAGQQRLPVVDAGYLGLYEVTLAYGQTTIEAQHIQRLDKAPFIDETLTQKISQSFADRRYLRSEMGDGRYLTPEQADARYLPFAEKGQPQGVATLDEHAQLPLSQLQGAFARGTGYQRLPSGLILQWGFAQNPNPYGQDITYPMTFPQAVCGIVATGGQGETNWADTINVQSRDTSHFTLYLSYPSGRTSISTYWFALGY
jgi:hypothetical protein